MPGAVGVVRLRGVAVDFTCFPYTFDSYPIFSHTSYDIRDEKCSGKIMIF